MVRRWLVDETAKADENEDDNKKRGGGRRPKPARRKPSKTAEGRSPEHEGVSPRETAAQAAEPDLS